MRLGTRFSVVLFLLLAQCSATAEDANLVALRKASNTCKTLLSQAAYQDAVSWAEVQLADTGMLAADPQLAGELRFCHALARSFDKLNESSTFIKQFVVAMSDLFEARQAGAPYQPQAMALESTILDNVLSAILVPLIADLEEISTTYADIAASESFTWKIDRLPVQIAGSELFDAAGTYDKGEVEILRGVVGAVLGSLYSLQALDYRVNIGAIIEYAKLADSPLRRYQEHPVAGVFNAAAVLLGTAPNFLALKGKDGAEFMHKAGATYTAAVKSLLDAAVLIKARQGDQGEHVIEYVRDGKQDYFVVHLTFNNELSSELQVDLEKFDDTSIPLRDDVLQSMTRVYDSLRAGGGVRAGVQTDVFPIMALVGVVALKSGALDAAIEESLDQIDAALAEKLRVTLDYSALSQEHLLSLLITAVPVAMEVDLGRAFAKPANLRDVLPAWFQPDPAPAGGFAMSAFTEATFVVEYECAANPLFTGSRVSIFCTGPVDQAHFAALGATQPWKNQASSNNFGPAWGGQIAADGVANRGPYIGFKDPSFGGTLFVDYSTISVPSPTGDTIAPASQSALNTLLATMTEAVLTVYQ